MSGGNNMPIYSSTGGSTPGGGSSSSALVIVVVVALLGLLALGGGAWWVFYSVWGDSEPEAAATPDDSTAPDRDPLEEPPYDAQTVEIRDVTLQFPEEWDVFQIDPEDSEVEIAFLVELPDPDGSCSEDTDWLDSGSDDLCPHVKLLPDDVHGDPRDSYYPEGHTSDDPPACEPELSLFERGGVAPPGVPGEELDIANSRVVQYEHWVYCDDGSEEMRSNQYIYEFEDQDVLAVDDWGSQEFFDALPYSGATPG